MARKSKRIPNKPCDHCTKPSAKLIRARKDPNSVWALVCDDCWSDLCASPNYQYGGLWKATKRR